MNIKIVANLHAFGGGELSAVWVAGRLASKGHSVSLHPVTGVNNHIRQAIPNGVRIRNQFGEIKDFRSDLLFFYANDAVYQLDKKSSQWGRLLKGADRSVLCLNFVTGPAGKPEWRDRWDTIIFLNSTKASGMLTHNKPRGNVVILPPPVDLEPYLQNRPRYPNSRKEIRVIRTGRYQRKYDKNQTLRLMEAVWGMEPNVRFSFMAAPPFIHELKDPRVTAYQMRERPVADLLGGSNLFWYPLPPDLKDQGPRVIVEAMASGIPCIADNRDGAKDRITEETGWLCDSDGDYISAFREVLDDPEKIKEKGEAAKKRAVEHFDPDNWIRAICP